MNLNSVSLLYTNRVVLIDTWWNVNVSFIFSSSKSPTVLIDTWWNVNVYLYDPFLTSYTVLIDTWWNVNVATVRMEVAMQNCFNRYMVECE